MWLVINLVGALLLLTTPAFADSCVFSLMPPYALKSDAVNWEMQIASGKTCTKGLKYGSVAISNGRGFLAKGWGDQEHSRQLHSFRVNSERI